jgi:branched-chain amino acid transport system permease protein
VTQFLQFTSSGLALGALYALVALGFVIVFKATHTLNLMQGGFVLLGAYLSYNAHVTWGWPFLPAVLASMLACGALAVVVQEAVIRRFTGQPLFAVLMATFGLLFVVAPVVSGVWGFDELNLRDPWGLRKVSVAGVSVAQRDLWVMGIAAVAVAVFFAFFRFTRTGIVMRAAAVDAEAAAAQGISPRLVNDLSWAMGGAMGALAGTMLATAVGGGVRPGLEEVAFLALPAIILGGLDSPVGAVVGGLVMGVAQQLSAGYAPESFGAGFSSVLPYLVMVAILLARPWGLFGTREIRRA